MVKISYNQKPYRRALMETYGAKCIASPSEETASGRAVLAEHPDSLGSLGIAISEAVEVAAQSDDTKYALGSVLNHVLLHQTVIGQEAIEQMAMADAYPDVVIGCAGGGSNFAGIAFPFLGEKIRNKRDVKVIAVEPAACPSMTRGVYAFDFGDTGSPHAARQNVHAGLDLHAARFSRRRFAIPWHVAAGQPLPKLGLIEARAYHQNPCFEAAVTFARTEGIVPAPESSHAIKAAVDEAVKAREEGRSPTILFNLSGHGHFDMQAYTDYLSGKLIDQDYDQAALDNSLAHLPKLAAE